MSAPQLLKTYHTYPLLLFMGYGLLDCSTGVMHAGLTHGIVWVWCLCRKMQAASWQLQERLQEQVDKLTEERDELARRLALAEDNAAAAGGTDAAIQDQLDSLRRYSTVLLVYVSNCQEPLLLVLVLIAVLHTVWQQAVAHVEWVLHLLCRRIQEEIERRSKVERHLAAVKDELAKFKNAREAVRLLPVRTVDPYVVAWCVAMVSSAAGPAFRTNRTTCLCHVPELI